MKEILIRHLANMGDLVFFVPPVLATLKKHYPNCHITFVTAWGFKEKKRWLASRSLGEGWGLRNQSGFAIHLMMTNPHIDQLVHWHDTKLSLDQTICHEDGKSFPTWNKQYYEDQKQSGDFDEVFELDFGLKLNDNPIQRMYDHIGLPQENFSDYKIYFSDSDLEVARQVMSNIPHPRIVLLEGLEGIEPVLILWSLARELRQLSSMVYQMQSDSQQQVLARHRVWQKRIPLFRAALGRMTQEGVQQLLLKAGHADRVIKGAAAGNAWDELIQLVLQLAGTDTGVRAAFP